MNSPVAAASPSLNATTCPVLVSWDTTLTRGSSFAKRAATSALSSVDASLTMMTSTSTASWESALPTLSGRKRP
jgi:hypothetical protein